MLDGRVLGASQVEYKPFGKPPLKREPRGGATARRWSPSTTLTSPACSGGCARASRPAGQGGSLAGPAGAEEPIRNMADARRRTIKAVYEDPRTGFGGIAQTLQQAQLHLQKGFWTASG